MPGPLLHQNALVQCAHGGLAQPNVVVPRVLVSGQAIVVRAPYRVAGCALPPPPGANGPCVLANFVTSAVRVFANVAMPVLLQDSQALCVPTGTPVIISAVQPRVVGM